MESCTIKCTKCKKEKQIDAFYRNARRSTGCQAWCKDCHSVAMKDRYANLTPEQKFHKRETERHRYMTNVSSERRRKSAASKRRRAERTPEEKSRQSEARKATYAATPKEKKRSYYLSVAPEERTRRRRKLKYNLTDEQLDAILASGECAICGTTEPGGAHNQWHIDHDHSCCPGQRSCGRCVRGLLCDFCNKGLGMFRDHAEILEAAARYLRRYSHV